MAKFYLDSEQVSPTGNISSQGILNQLGRPNLSHAAVLVREAVQNSWDARLSEQRTVHFEISAWELDLKQKRFLKDSVFSDTPPSKTSGIDNLFKSKEPIHLLAIYDRGTTGLGGPTRADEFSKENESRDFVDFLRNVGQPSNKKFSGGTYGYGKAAYYRASKVNTICVYTRCKYQGKAESRFFVSGLGSPFQSKRVKFTGRHWWGRKSRGIAEPILDLDADRIAERLGIKVFKKNEFGSAIVIIQPHFPNNLSNDEGCNDTLETALNMMAENLVLYFWPKMLVIEGHIPMSFKLTLNNQPIPVPDPAQYAPIKPFVQAMYRLKNKRSTKNNTFKHSISDICSQRPQQVLGRLALQMFGTDHFLAESLPENGFHTFTHHIALMRQPELIVKYFEGPAFETNTFGYAGVFITDQEVDEVFAQSEPPTHDDWVPNSLEERTHKTFVRVALREIFREMEGFAKPFAVQVHDSELRPLGGFSTRLANSILPTVVGWAANTDMLPNDSTYKEKEKVNVPISDATGANSNYSSEQIKDWNVNSSDILNPPSYIRAGQTKPENGNTKKSLVGRAHVKVLADDDFIFLNGKRAIKITISINHGKNSSGTNIKVIPRALIDDGHNEVEPPIGGSEPEVLLWIDSDGKNYAGTDEIFISKSSDEVWHVIIYVPEDIMLGVDFKAEAQI